MHAAPLAALDLPRKVLVLSDAHARTNVSDTAPTVMTARYDLDPDLR